MLRTMPQLYTYTLRKGQSMSRPLYIQCQHSHLPLNFKCSFWECSTRAERAETQRTGIPERRLAQVILTFATYNNLAGSS